MNQRFYRLVLSGMLATGLTLCAAAAFAQDAGGGGGRRAPMTPDQQLAQMTTRYNLTADQQAKIKPILEDQASQMATMRSDSSMSQDDRMAKMSSLRTSSQAKIAAVLTDQQKQQYQADQQRMPRGGGGGGNGGGGGAPPQ
jgi:periplasmic protein CpxP/Spy